MKKLIVLACLATTISMTAATAMADNIRGKLGVTGKLGFLAPADNNVDNFNNRTDTGAVVGVGLIYGIDNHLAAELEVTRSEFDSNNGDFGVTNVSLGGQYRFGINDPKLVPYLGVGIDILATDYDPDNGSSRDVDTTAGVHVSGGVDYFLQQNLALTAEVKVVAAPETDITDNSGAHRGDFDPSSLSTTVGLRYFFN